MSESSACDQIRPQPTHYVLYLRYNVPSPFNGLGTFSAISAFHCRFGTGGIVIMYCMGKIRDNKSAGATVLT